MVKHIHNIQPGEEFPRPCVKKFSDCVCCRRKRVITRRNPSVALEAFASRTNLREVEHQNIGAPLPCKQLTNKFRPRFGRITACKVPYFLAAAFIKRFCVLFGTLLLLKKVPLASDNLNLHLLREPIKGPYYRLKTNTTTLQQQPKRIHHIMNGFDFKESTVEHCGFSPLGNISAAKP